MHFRLYFPRWRFPYNLGDTVMLSCVFKAVRHILNPDLFEVIADQTTVDLFYNDPYVDRLRTATWLERKLIKKIDQGFFGKNRVVLWPTWQESVFQYLATGDHLQCLIESPNRNVLSLNNAWLLGPEFVEFEDLRPRIHLTAEELHVAREEIPPNSIAIHVAQIRNTQSRLDGETLRFRRDGWQVLVSRIKQYDPSITIWEVGRNAFLGVGDQALIVDKDIRSLAARLAMMRLVILSDGGIHNVCNAIDKNVLLFQAYEFNPPDMFKMGNALFNPDYHLQCRLGCHIFSDILKTSSTMNHCNRECYGLDAHLLAEDAISFLRRFPLGG
ncbi:MAG: hypothetical protein H7839_06965 [Magnetococcus sp. YQC-5]